MDALTRQMADFASRLSYEQLPMAVVAASRRFLVDTLACAITARDCESVWIGLRLAEGAAPARYPGRIICHSQRSSAEAAAFVNMAIFAISISTTSIRQPPATASAHFSRLPKRQYRRRRLVSHGRRIRALRRLSDATGLVQGWDQGFAAGIGTAAGVGHLLRLPPEQIGEAIAIVAVPIFLA
jgi:2-methylcitrate dehydratase PrpD